MLHGTHFQVENEEELPEDKIWGPYLWYFNDGSISDANRRLKKEQYNWPYKWFNNKKFSSRGSLKRRLALSNGAPASNVNSFLGNSDYTMVQGASYKYTVYTDEEGYFQLSNIRTENKYYLQAYTSEWSSKYTDIGGVIGNFTYNEEIEIKKDSSLDLGKIEWKAKDYELIWQIGTYDRTSKGFKNGGVSYRDFQTEEAPAEF
jgi:rhamnogalacturonan endolyase